MRHFLGLGLISGLFSVSLLVACGSSGSSSTSGTGGSVNTGGAGGGGTGGAGQGGTGMGGAGQGGAGMGGAGQGGAGMGGAGMGGAGMGGAGMGGAGQGNVASSSSSSGGGMGGAGVGGAGQGGAASSSSVGVGGASASASSVSVSSSASTGGFDPQVCSQCAFNKCQAEIFACGQPCQNFYACAQNCTDKACADACLMQYPEAKPTYDCTCASCTADCGGICDGSGTSTSASVSASASSSASASASSGTGGGGTCATCSQAVYGSQDPLCMGSDKLLLDLQTCTCQVNCTNVCTASCAGGPVDQTCLTCVQTKCSQQFNACLND